MKYIISNWEWIAPVLGIISSAFFGWLGKRYPQLDAKMNNLLKLVGGKDAVIELIATADKIANATSAEKQALVAEKITLYLERQTGIVVPKSEVNLLVEWCYRVYKDKVAK